MKGSRLLMLLNYDSIEKPYDHIHLRELLAATDAPSRYLDRNCTTVGRYDRTFDRREVSP